MSEPLELQQVLCPSCRQVISSFSPFAAHVECPYCHNMGFNPLITKRQIEIPERIIPFRSTQADFEKRLITNLIWQEHVPQDIFECYRSVRIFKAFLPMYLFEGRFQTSWNCMVATKVNRATNSASEYRPHSGNTCGNFSGLCLACHDEDIPQQLKDFCSRFDYDAEDTVAFDPQWLEGGDGLQPLAYAPDSDKEVLWDRHGKEQIKQQAARHVRKMLRDVSINNLSTSTSYELQNPGRLLLIPFWFTAYDYKGGRHYAIMDGLGRQHSLTIPQDQSEVRTLRKMKRKLLFEAGLSALGVLGLCYLLSGSKIMGVAWLACIVWLLYFGWRFYCNRDTARHMLKVSLRARKASALRLGVVSPAELAELDRNKEKELPSRRSAAPATPGSNL